MLHIAGGFILGIFLWYLGLAIIGGLMNVCASVAESWRGMRKSPEQTAADRYKAWYTQSTAANATRSYRETAP